MSDIFHLNLKYQIICILRLNLTYSFSKRIKYPTKEHHSESLLFFTSHGASAHTRSVVVATTLIVMGQNLIEKNIV